MKDYVLRTKKITKKYKNHIAVDKVNVEIKQGEIYGLIGKNGAGKTTLLRMVSGLTIPTSGEVELFGEITPCGLNRARMRTGCIIETPSFFPYLSATKNLDYYRMQKGIVDKKSVQDTLNIVGLQDSGRKKFKDFSLGMKQRLGLAFAIIGSPDLLILDEPINGLDPTGIVEFRELLLKLNRERNITIILSSHILGELSQIATTYGFVHNGKMLEQVSSKELTEKCRRFLLIKVSDTAKSAVIMERELKTNKYEILNDNEIRLYDHIDTPELVTNTLVNNGIMISSIHQTGINLENYFLNLIGGVAHD